MPRKAGVVSGEKKHGSKYTLETRCTYNHQKWESNPWLIGAKRGDYRYTTCIPVRTKSHQDAVWVNGLLSCNLNLF